MITFWVFAVVMMIIALVFLLRPLLLELNKKDIDRSAQNVAITKERLNELKTEFEQGTISQTEFEQTKDELEHALLNDIEESSVKSNISDNKYFTHLARYILILSVPVMSVGFYSYLGQPDLIEGAKKHAAAPGGHALTTKGKKLPSVEEMIEKLAEKLKENPDSAEGWFMLARSYMSMDRYKEAVAALEKANKLIPDNPTVMLRYADALIMQNGGRISGKPFDLIKRAVEIQPDNSTGLWLIGMGYEEQGAYEKAISYWNLLLPLLKDNQSIDEVNTLIRSAKSKAGISVAENSTATATKAEKKAAISLKINVSIAENVLKKVSMDDTVYIFAKAVSGPPMPLAVVRKQVKDFPLQVILDDSMAMIPDMKISSFPNVMVSAHISRSGQPRARSGDVKSEIRTVNSSQKEKIKLTISDLIP